MTEQTSKLSVFPLTAEVDGQNRLVLGGCDVASLIGEFGTPLYIYDEHTLREKCREFTAAFCDRYPTTINYSCKAFLNKAVLDIVNEEGFGLDVVSGGEIGIAVASGYPAAKIDFPGNNKSAEELILAIQSGVRHIVVDNRHELEVLGTILRDLGKTQDILLRLSPGVTPDTHRFITTGNVDSKFGIPIALGEPAVERALAMPEVNLKGLHFHIGSQISEFEPYEQAIRVMVAFAAEMHRKHGFVLQELSVGGGFAHHYLPAEPVPEIDDYAAMIVGTIRDSCRSQQIDEPVLIIEPGRSMVAGAGVALYTVGVIKDIPEIRRFVAIDGGMCDNIRPALYGARVEAVVANKMNEPDSDVVTICGKYCESSDILIRDIALPKIEPGDILAVPGCGAYNLTESMNYNASMRPAVVMVHNGKARLIRRRETIDDLMRCDVR